MLLVISPLGQNLLLILIRVSLAMLPQVLRMGFRGLASDTPLSGLLRPTDSLVVTVDKTINYKPFEPEYKYVVEITRNGDEVLRHTDDYKVYVLRLKSRCPELFSF